MDEPNPCARLRHDILMRGGPRGGEEGAVCLGGWGHLTLTGVALAIPIIFFFLSRSVRPFVLGTGPLCRSVPNVSNVAD